MKTTQQPMTKGPSAGLVPVISVKKPLKRLILIVTIVGTVILFVFFLKRTGDFWWWLTNPTTSAQTATISVSQPREGMTEINQYSWNGVQCLQPNMRINWEILGPTIWWDVAFDGRTNDADVVHLFPAKHSQGDVLDVKTPHKRVDWRVHPTRNPSGTTAKVIWEIVPDH